MPGETELVHIDAGAQRDKSGNGWIREIEVADISRYMSELSEFMETRHPEVLKTIREKKDLTDDVKAALDRALGEFADVFQPTKTPEGKAKASEGKAA